MLEWNMLAERLGAGDGQPPGGPGDHEHLSLDVADSLDRADGHVRDRRPDGDLAAVNLVGLLAGQGAAGARDESRGVLDHEPDEPVDLRVDRLGRDLVEHPGRGIDCWSTSPQTPLAITTRKSTISTVLRRPAPAEPAVIDQQRHRQKSEPDVGGHPVLDPADSPGSTFFRPPEGELEEDQQAAGDPRT